MSNVVIAGTAAGATALPVANSIDAVQDYIPVYTNSATATQAINRNTYLNLASQPLGLTDTQSPTNKTFNNTNSFTIKDGSLTLQNTAATTKQATFSLSGITAGQTRIITLPDYNATVASLAGAETLTNKTLTSPTINTATIVNPTVTIDSINEYTLDNGVTIDGVNIKDNVLNTSNCVVTSNITAANVTAAKMQFGMIRQRQGGTTGDASWATSGTSNTDTSAKAAFWQAGYVNITGNSQDITFPVAYNQVPLAMVACVNLTAKSYAVINSITATKVNVSVVDTTDNFNTAQAVMWMAVGQ